MAEAPDTSYLSELDLQTLAEDKRYQAEILKHHPTVFFRPDDRTATSYPGYWKADTHGTSYIRFITKYGSHAKQQPPQFLPEHIPVRVVSREAKILFTVPDEECAHAYKELENPAAVLAWLQKKYPDAQLTLYSMVTVYRIEY